MRSRASRLVLFGLSVLCAGASSCGGPPTVTYEDATQADDGGAESIDAARGDATRSHCSTTSEVVHFETSDGVTLEADLSTPGNLHAPGVVLLHMIPPSNDRQNYPPAFIDALRARGFAVLNVDRRGAGGSTGVATEAYSGPNGRLDAEAAITFLVGHACGIDPARVAIVGASNGTTTMLDYTVTASVTSVHPRALVYLTAGAYTESQHPVADHRALPDPIPSLFVFATSERAFSAALMVNAPTAWEFREYDPGAHGTRMFAAEAASIEIVANFLARAVEAH